MPEVAQKATDKPPRKKRSYTKEFIANALNVLQTHKGNVLAASRELEIPRLTLRDWAINGTRVDDEVREIQHEKAPEMQGVLDDTAALYLDHARNPLVIAASSGLEAVKAAAICIDKSRLLQDLPTSIVGSVDRQELSVTLYAALGELDELETLDPIDRAKNITPPTDRPQDMVVFQG